MAKPTEGESTLCRNKILYVHSLLKHGFWVTSFWQLKKMLQVPTLSFKAGCCTCEQWLPDLLENSRCHLQSILVHCYKFWVSLTALPQTVDFTCLQRWKCKGFKSAEQAGHAVGPRHPIHCSRNTVFKNSQTAWRMCGGAPQCIYHKWILACISTSCNSSGTLFKGNHGKQLLWDTVEESRVPEVCLLQCLHWDWRWTLWAFLLIVRRP